MKRNHTLSQRCMAYILLVGLLLQSCNSPAFLIGPNKQEPTPIEGKGPKTNTFPFIEETHETTEDLAKPVEPSVLVLESTKAITVAEEKLSTRQPIQSGPIELAKKSQQAPSLQSRVSSESVQRTQIKTNQVKTNQAKTNQAQDKFSRELLKSKRGADSLQVQKRLGENQRRSSNQEKALLMAQQLAGSTMLAKQKAQLASSRKAIIPVGLNPLVFNQEAPNKIAITKGRYEIEFQQTSSGSYQAVVKETFQAGITRKNQVPLFFASGYHMHQLAKHSPAWQKNHIHLIEQIWKELCFCWNSGPTGRHVHRSIFW